MKECLDEGMLQAWLDGELSEESAEKTALHLTSCMTCADAAREMQSEMSLLATALATEFDVSVPTERLRNRIEDAIAELQPSPVRAQVSSGRSWLQRFTDLFAVPPQRAFSYAAVTAVLIAVVALGVIYLKRGEVSRGTEIAKRGQPVTPAPAPASVPSPAPLETPDHTVTAENAPKKSLKRAPRRENESAPRLIPGEQDYLKTIATLDATIKSDPRMMRPAIQVEYEHNLAVVNQAIANTRGVAHKNPNDPDTAKFMFSAYQSKVDLLTQVADARLFNTQPK
jgi:hypothetical protein